MEQSHRIDDSSARSPDVVVEARAVRHSYGSSPALAGVDLAVPAGQSVAVTGRSGSGKTTLLYCLAGIVRPTSGSVHVGGENIVGLDDAEASRMRATKLGFVFQFGELVAELDLRENVALPLRLAGVRRRAARARTDDVLRRLDIADVAERRPGEVSGGQAQRAAVGRALVHRPGLVLADEPTGSLDSANRDIVLRALLSLASDVGSAVVLVTHEAAVARHCARRVELVDGQVAGDVERTAG